MEAAQPQPGLDRDQLWRNGEKVEANARHCPQTSSFSKAFHSRRSGGSGPNACSRSSLRNGDSAACRGEQCTAGLPTAAGFRKRLGRVGAETRFWKRGEAFVFDDTIEHEALNPSDELRVVFIFDIWHPDLSATERDAVAALIGSEGGVGAL